MEEKLQLTFFLVLTLLFTSVCFVLPARASTTNGIINSTNKYAWGSKIGWINFGATNGNVSITDSRLTGYAWNDLYGWINLNPTNGGVTNDTAGVLSGYAWGEKVGWINFSGVKISSAGVFTGTATGTIVGTINFGCTNCSVITDWRPRATRPACNNSTDDDNDGKIDYPTDLGCSSLTDTDETDMGGSSLPAGIEIAPVVYSNSILINEGAIQTNSLTVILKLIGDVNTSFVFISEKPDLTPAEKVDYSPPSTTYQFNFSAGEGMKKVYAKFCNGWGYCSSIISASIIYSSQARTTTTEYIGEQPAPAESATSSKVGVETEIKTDAMTAKEAIAKVLKGLVAKLDLVIPDILKPWKKYEAPKIEDIRKYVSAEEPLAMKGKWQLLPSEAIKIYVFAPLPSEFKALAARFPQIKNLLDETGVKRFNDLHKLVDAKIDIPGLSQAIGLPAASIKAGILQPYKSVPVGQLADFFKKKIPFDMVFAAGANQMVDFNSVLTLGDKGEPVQRLATISGKKIFLSIRPERKAKSVKGYIIFKQRKYALLEEKSFIASLFSIEPAMAYPEPIKVKIGDRVVERKLVLQEFEYKDEDKDGVYTAEVYSPVPEGEYEIMTVIEYEDADYGKKIIGLVAVVDPEGYVYEKIKGKEMRVPDALVELFWLNPASKKYELWPASEYQQQNGQVTDVRGKYSFLVPPGSYYLRVKAPGYKIYISEQFKVVKGEAVHMNIELESKDWWRKAFDWKIWIIIVLVMNLLYMIERDIKRRQRG